jgi:GMP synthase (glutamine-hydrolysing)
MRICYLQHVPFEGLAGIENWAKSKGHSLDSVKIFNNDPFPSVDGLDWLIVMGGPMSVYEEDKYPWLVQEKRFIRAAVTSGKAVLGICLGAQLIADVLGARVYPNQYKEIGWFPIELTEEGAKSGLFDFMPEQFTVFHWHGDTFDLPEGAVRTARSEGCLNQAFVYGEKVVALQFHMESTKDSIQAIVHNCSDEIVSGKYIQTAGEIFAGEGNLSQINMAMNGLLDRISSKA